MKPGTRALGIAESYRSGTDEGGQSTLAGTIVSANGVVDEFVFSSCTVGGTDATDAIVGMVERLGRPDIQYIFVAGIAPAWFNIVDIRQIATVTDRPTLSVSFEESDGLEPALRREFSEMAAAKRIETYRKQPARRPVTVTDETLFVRTAGEIPAVDSVVRGFCSEEESTAARPEPLRIAQLAARGVSEWRQETSQS